MGNEKYDLIVIGAGSGSPVAEAAVGHMGWRTALIEKGPQGGTCLNRGCIPSKMVIHAADVAETVQNAGRFGVHAGIDRIDFASITGRANEHVDAEAAAIEKFLLEESPIDFYKETGYFTAPYTLQVGDRRIDGDRILIAAGSRPAIPAIEGLDRVNYWTSTEALRQTRLPASLVILGGGYISAELCHFYGALGCEVTIVQRSGRLLRGEDETVSETFTRLFGEKYRLLLNHRAVKVADRADGSKSIIVEDEGGHSRELHAEALLVATGRRPNTDLLSLDKTAVELDARGYIKTDEFLETSQENVWALGDIIKTPPFKHTANYEAQFVFWNMTGTNRQAVDYSIMPHAVFSSPQIAGVGLTEQEARRQGGKFKIRRHNYIDTGMGKAMEAEEGFVKFIIDPEKDAVLGCHILGPHASILIHEVIVAMTVAKGSAAAILQSIHIHPALAEVVQRAL